MSQPAKRFQPEKLYKIIKLQLWILFIILMFSIIIEQLLTPSQLIFSKSLLAGGALNWLAQYLFVKIACRVTKIKLSRQIVYHLYLAQIVKWLVNLLGFAIIFIYLKPILTIAVLLGFMLLQLSHIVLLAKQS